ncbi:MAG: O-antigen ligase family protein, partial [Bacillota bacterium]
GASVAIGIVRAALVRLAMPCRRVALISSRILEGSVVAGLFRIRPNGLSRYLPGSLSVSAASSCVDAVLSILRPVTRTAILWWNGSITRKALRRLVSAIMSLRDLPPANGSLFVNMFVRLLDAVMAEPAAAGLALILGIIPFAPTTGLVVLSLVLAGVEACRWSLAVPRERRRQVFARGAADVPALFLLFAVLLAVLTSASRRASIPAFILWCGYAGIFLVSSSVRPTRSALRIVAAALVLSAVLVSAAGIVQFIRKPETSQSWIDTKVFESITTRVYSVFDNPNILAEFLAFALPLAVALLLHGGSTAVLLVPAIAAIGICLAVTFSRGGWAAAAIGTAVVVAMKDRRLLALALVVAIIAFPLLPEAIRMRAVTAATMADSSSRYRFTIWKSSLRMARDYWASGVGLGSTAFSFVYPAYEIAGTPAAHTHNLYLQILVEMGAPGLLAFIWLLACFFGETRGAKTADGLIFAALAGGIGGQIVHGVIDNIWYSPKIVFLFWAVFGLALALSRAAQEERSSP